MAELTYYTNGYRVVEVFPDLDAALDAARQIIRRQQGYVYSIVHDGKTYARPNPNETTELDRLLWPEMYQEKE